MADPRPILSGSPDAESWPAAAESAPGPAPPRRPSRHRLRDVVLAISLTLNVLGAAAFTARAFQKGGFHYLLERLDLRDARHPLLPFQADWRTRLRKLPDTEGEIVFAGDSLVADGPWSELYSPIKNRGIGGETTAGLLDRLDEVTASRPRKIFFLVGTNCLAADIPVAQVVRNYRKILERVRHESPQTQVFIISVPPVNQRLPAGPVPVHSNATIRALNDRLRALTGEFPGTTFLDVFDALADSHGDLRKELTVDGLHLNLDGYLVLGRLLERYVTDQAPQVR
jgi:lysophospholipase L1-like esterase